MTYPVRRDLDGSRNRVVDIDRLQPAGLVASEGFQRFHRALDAAHQIARLLHLDRDRAGIAAFGQQPRRSERVLHRRQRLADLMHDRRRHAAKRGQLGGMDQRGLRLAQFLLGATPVVPAVNRLEIHPYFRQRAVLGFDDEHGILDQAWSPIGGITFYRNTDGSRGTLDDPVIGSIARTHGKSPAQVMLRWHVQQGRSAIPKSVKPSRIQENFAIFDFELTDAELAQLDALDTGGRTGDPDRITLETFDRTIPEA